MGGFFTGVVAAVLIAAGAYWAYLRYDVPSGNPSDELSVILSHPGSMTPDAGD